MEESFNSSTAQVLYMDLVFDFCFVKLFSLAYHQSRWNYNNERDVAEYVSNIFLQRCNFY